MLSVGWNSRYTMSCGIETPSRHAEAMAIEQLFTKRTASCYEYLHKISAKLVRRGHRNLSIMVIRLDSLGNLCSSKCCTECIKLLQSFSIKTAIWSTNEGTLSKARVNIMKTDFVSTGNRLWKK